ncbi:MAG: leucyl aminopeptidase [Desulfocapsa sp.]|nr:leucyl aminopeptidase [Desulfocapsa sp.]
MESTKISLIRKAPENYRGDLLVYCLHQDEKEKLVMGSTLATKELKKAVALGDFKGKESDLLHIYPQGTGRKKVLAGRILFLGLGKLDGCSQSDLRERFRKAGGSIAAKAAALNAEKICLCLPDISLVPGEVVGECLVEGILLGDYRFLKYKKKETKDPSFTGIKGLGVHAAGGEKGIRRGLSRALHSAYAARAARDMANEPGNGWTPQSFAAYAQELAVKHNMKCTVFDKSHMKRLKMGGILAVNQGSAEPPKMVILEYKTLKKKAQTILIVGKGLTFDSGGVSLKPAAKMEEMKYDMCGGAAALSAMGVVGEEKPDVNVVAIIPATDNMSGSSALKPGDIICHYGGITSEIINTDAEGRLILADALAYGINKFNPTCVVDLATLTGAVILGLGHHRTGLLGNSQELVDRLLLAGENCGELLWQLPLDKEYGEQIDSDVADIKNTGGRPAGTITAAAYLQKFVDDTPWAHLDIAGTAWNFTEKTYIPKGPSGTGVRTLVDLIRNWKKFQG